MFTYLLLVGVPAGNRSHPASIKPQLDSKDPRLKFAMQSCDPRLHFALVCGAKVTVT